MAEARRAAVKDEGGAEVAEFPGPLSLAELFGREMEAEEVSPRLAMPPALAGVRRAVRTLPIPDLKGLAPMWALIGRGNTGKTLFARYVASRLLEQKIGRFILAALDPGPRLLAEFRVQVMTPPSTDPAETTAWLRTLFALVMKHRAPGAADMGGGDTSLNTVIRAAPTLAQEMCEAGVALIPAYFFAAPDDPAIIEAHAATGFRPDAMALVLNLNNVDSAGGFDAVRAHPAYKAALDRGAVEIVIPRLEPLKLSQRIETRRFHFHEARDGIVPEGSGAPPIENGLERAAIREWLEIMARELAAIEAAGWLPWS
jgi:hypothetical protein